MDSRSILASRDASRSPLAVLGLEKVVRPVLPRLLADADPGAIPGNASFQVT